MEEIIPNGYELLNLEGIVIQKDICPNCRDKILLDKYNKYYHICKCGYTWKPGTSGAIAIIPLK